MLMEVLIMADDEKDNVKKCKGCVKQLKFYQLRGYFEGSWDYHLKCAMVLSAGFEIDPTDDETDEKEDKKTDKDEYQKGIEKTLKEMQEKFQKYDKDRTTWEIEKTKLASEIEKLTELNTFFKKNSGT